MADEIEGVAVRDSVAVVVSGKRLTPERTEALTAAAAQFASQVVRVDGSEPTGAPLVSPVAAG